MLLLSAIEVILRAPGLSRAHCCLLQTRYSGSLCPLAHLHLIPDNHANIPPPRFLQAGCPSCRPTNSVKALNDSTDMNRNIINFHTRVKYVSLSPIHSHIQCKPTGRKTSKTSLPLGGSGPIYYTTAWTDPTYHPKQQLDHSTHIYTTTQQSPLWLQWVTPHLPQNCPLPWSVANPFSCLNLGPN